MQTALFHATWMPIEVSLELVISQQFQRVPPRPSVSRFCVSTFWKREGAAGVGSGAPGVGCVVLSRIPF